VLHRKLCADLHLIYFRFLFLSRAYSSYTGDERRFGQVECVPPQEKMKCQVNGINFSNSRNIQNDSQVQNSLPKDIRIYGSGLELHRNL